MEDEVIANVSIILLCAAMKLLKSLMIQILWCVPAFSQAFSLHISSHQLLSLALAIKKGMLHNIDNISF
jgi:hypothetical protein